MLFSLFLNPQKNSEKLISISCCIFFSKFLNLNIDFLALIFTSSQAYSLGLCISKLLAAIVISGFFSSLIFFFNNYLFSRSSSRSSKANCFHSSLFINKYIYYYFLKKILFSLTNFFRELDLLKAELIEFFYHLL